MDRIVSGVFRLATRNIPGLQAAGRAVVSGLMQGSRGVGAVVQASHTDQRSTLMVRMDGPVDPAWSAHEVTLEDVILAYLADGEAEGSNTAWGVPT